LRSNEIKILIKDTFPYLKDLEELDLSYNNIETINQESFIGLIKLKNLDISANITVMIGQQDLPHLHF